MHFRGERGSPSHLSEGSGPRADVCTMCLKLRCLVSGQCQARKKMEAGPASREGATWTGTCHGHVGGWVTATFTQCEAVGGDQLKHTRGICLSSNFPVY